MTFDRRAILGMLAALGSRGADKSGMNVLSKRPEDYEMPLRGFRDWITPVNNFFVRSHHYTPRVNAADWRLTIGGMVSKPATLTLDDLRKMPAVEVIAVCECAGNGRGLYRPSMPGLQWKYGGVGNARWRGVRLRDLLRRVEVLPGAHFVHCDGADVPVGNQPNFERSLPLAKAMNEHTLLAYEMNGAPLDPSHGFPLRVVAPGWASDSWVKWLTKMELTAEVPDVFYMKTGYRHPGRAVKPGTSVKPEDMHPVEDLQIKSVIAAPLEGDVIPVAANTKIAGAAWSGEIPVASIELSIDRGRTWQPARVTSPKSDFGFSIWEYDWRPSEPGYYVLMARARDARGKTQPFTQEWNPSGYSWNVVHQVAVQVGEAVAAAPSSAPPEPPAPPAEFSKACLTCHDIGPIQQQSLSRAQWEAEVGKMQRWGAPVTDDSRSRIVEYLAARWGPKN